MVRFTLKFYQLDKKAQREITEEILELAERRVRERPQGGAMESHPTPVCTTNPACPGSAFSGDRKKACFDRSHAGGLFAEQRLLELLLDGTSRRDGATQESGLRVLI